MRPALWMCNRWCKSSSADRCRKVLLSSSCGLRTLVSLSLGKCWGRRSASHQVNLSLREECLQQSASMMRLMELSQEKEKSHWMCRTGGQQMTLCRPVLTDRPAAPERCLFSEQLHLAALSPTASQKKGKPPQTREHVLVASSSDVNVRETHRRPAVADDRSNDA